jgi:hypothetical protein
MMPLWEIALRARGSYGDELLPRFHAARRLGVTKGTFARYLKAGRITPVRGKQTSRGGQLFSARAVDELKRSLERCREAAPGPRVVKALAEAAAPLSLRELAEKSGVPIYGARAQLQELRLKGHVRAARSSDGYHHLVFELVGAA